MLDIYTCIISCIVFRDLVPDIYFHDTDTWDLCDMYYLNFMMFLDWPCDFILWYCILVILWLCYTTVTRPGHLMFIIYMSHHSCMQYTVSLYMIYRLNFLLLLLLSVLDTAKYIVLLISMPYLCCYYIFIFFLLLFFSFMYSCWSASEGPLLFFNI